VTPPDAGTTPRALPTRGFPRDFRICGAWINSYKVLLCVGLWVGSLASAALAQQSGLSPLHVGLAGALCAVAGLAGARIYHVLCHARQYLALGSVRALWDGTRGGWSIFGALLTFVPATLLAASSVGVPIAVLWDHLASGVLLGGVWIRCGCVFNGCCAGRESHGAWAVRLHDVHGVRKPRVPVQFLEMAWWLAGTAVYLAQWGSGWSEGSYALGVLGWYGLGRTALEPLREHPDRVLGGVPVNQVVAALLAAGAGIGVVLLNR
jgi:phosphatidylglycerol---prolipoprotein diacylglyceryl transferase